MRFFVDNCLAPKHVRALASLVEPDHAITHLREKFSPDAKDHEWLPSLKHEAQTQPWIVISGDFDIIRKRRNQVVWRDCGLTSFFLVDGWMNLKMWDQHVKLAGVMPRIIATAEQAQSGSGFKVRIQGRLDPIVWA